jgi:hypothetical protein
MKKVAPPVGSAILPFKIPSATAMARFHPFDWFFCQPH